MSVHPILIFCNVFAAVTPVKRVVSPYRGGRPTKSECEYVGGLAVQERQFQKNIVRRRQREKRKHFQKLHPSIKRSRGRPINYDDEVHGKRRDARRILEARRVLEAACRPLGISPDGDAFAHVLREVSKTKRGQKMLPMISAEINTTKSLANFLSANPRLTLKSGLVRALCESAKPGDVSKALCIKPSYAYKAKEKTNSKSKKSEEQL